MNAATTTTAPATMLTSREAATLLKIKTQTLRAWRLRGDGPRFVRYTGHGHGPAYYLLDDVTSWLDSRRRTSTSDESARAATA